MNQPTLADAQREALILLKEGECSAAVHHISKQAGGIRQTAINLLTNDLIDDKDVNTFIERVTIQDMQKRAHVLMQTEGSRAALIFLRKQLSRIRQCAARVNCTPFLMLTDAKHFIENLGQDMSDENLPARHQNLHPSQQENEAA